VAGTPWPVNQALHIGFDLGEQCHLLVLNLQQFAQEGIDNRCRPGERNRRGSFSRDSDSELINSTATS
jgi:hypothetical protein